MVPTNEREAIANGGSCWCIAERGIETNPVMIYTELQHWAVLHKTNNNTSLTKQKISPVFHSIEKLK